MGMRKIGTAAAAFLFPMFFFYSANAENVFFGEHQNQIRMTVGQSIKGGVENLYTGSLVYSQSDSFFRIPSRVNLELGGFLGKSSSDPNQDFSQFNLAYLGISKDVQLLKAGKFYTSIGLGAYIKNKKSDRIGSLFAFGQTVSLGYNAESVLIEAYVRHFSNGSLTKDNLGQNFYGLSVGYNF